MSESRDMFIRGESVVLRALRDEDLSGDWYRWFNDNDVTWFQNKGIFPNTFQKQEAFLRHLQSDASHVTLAIDVGGRHVGNVTLKDIDWVHRTAEIGIVIGDKSYWGKGLGNEAWWLMTRYGLLTLNLNKITARIFAGNENSLRVARRSGFVVEGEHAEQFYRHGEYHSLVMLGVTGKRWRACFGADERATFSQSAAPVESK